MREWLSRLFGGNPVGADLIEIGDLRSGMASASPPVIVDVRGADEFDGPLGHIEGARNIPLPELSAHLPELARSRAPIVCVCLTDKRSAQAAADLIAAGARNVSVLRGGMRAWRAAQS